MKISSNQLKSIHPNKDDEVEEAAEEGVGGSFDVYRNMSRGYWQVHQGQWMDVGESHLQIDPFLGRESDYHPYGYTGPMPFIYDYRYSLALGGSS
nr:hypothetical protein [Tanacetum cinerariifolium]